MSGSDKLEKVDDGAFASVWITRGASSDLRRQSAKDRAKIRSYIGLFAAHGHAALPNKEKFRHETKITVGKFKNISVWAFKSFQVRLYGAMVPDKSNRFVCVAVDVKKKDRADKALLERVAKEVVECVNR